MQLKSLSTHKYFSRMLTALAVVLVSPSLIVGLQFDDYLLRQTIVTAPDFLAALSRPFIFMDGDPVHTQQLMDSGAFPWWALPEGRVSFWRPLAALTHWIDFSFLPQAVSLMHVQNIFWFAATVFAVTKLYQKLMPDVWVAGLAAIFYAFDYTHGFAVGWLSNRNGLMAIFFGVLALIAHASWRRDARRWGAVAAPLLLMLGLFSAEAAIAMLAYLISYAIFVDRASPASRALSLLPYFIVVILWRWMYQGFGFGAWGTSYIDPMREPTRYLAAVIERGPILLLAQWTLLPSELYPYLSKNVAVVWWGASVVVLLSLAIIFFSLVKRDSLARFWMTGMMLSLLPPSSSLPANRLLFFVGLGAMGLLAQYILSSNNKPKFLVRLLILLHLLIAPLLLPFTAFSPSLLGNIEPSISSLPNEPNFTTQSAIIVNAPSFFHSSYIANIRSSQGLPAPARVRALASGLMPISISRTDSHTLVVRPADGYLTGFDSVFRGDGQPMRRNQIVVLIGVTITVQEITESGYPLVVSFRFDVPLEDQSLRWLQWQNGFYAPFDLPPVGQTVVLPPLSLMPSLLER